MQRMPVLVIEIGMCNNVQADPVWRRQIHGNTSSRRGARAKYTIHSSINGGEVIHRGKINVHVGDMQQGEIVLGEFGL